MVRVAKGGVMTAVGLFLTPVTQDLGIGMGSLSLYFSISSIVTMIFLPIAGKMMGKFDIKVLLIGGVILQAGSFAMFGFMNSVWGWYLFSIPMAIGSIFVTQMAALAEEVHDRFGKIDILVNNAGISSEKPFDQIDIEDWQKINSINGYGPFAGIKHVAPYMAAQKKGSIINISSYTALIGQGFNHYSASKGAVRTLSKAAATTFSRQGVRANTLFPRIIDYRFRNSH